MFQHSHAALITLQDIFFTVERNQKGDTIWTFFSDVLADTVEPAKWQYILLLYAFFQPNAPKGSFGLKDLNNILHSLYPKATDDEVQNLMLRFREMGLVRSESMPPCFPHLVGLQRACPAAALCDRVHTSLGRSYPTQELRADGFSFWRP